MNPAMAALWHGDDSSKDIATVGAHRQREVVCRLFLFSEADNALYPCLFLPRGLKGSRFVEAETVDKKGELWFYLQKRVGVGSRRMLST